VLLYGVFRRLGFVNLSDWRRDSGIIKGLDIAIIFACIAMLIWRDRWRDRSRDRWRDRKTYKVCVIQSL
jgi:hypothetical protein